MLTYATENNTKYKKNTNTNTVHTSKFFLGFLNSTQGQIHRYRFKYIYICPHRLLIQLC